MTKLLISSLVVKLEYEPILSLEAAEDTTDGEEAAFGI